VDPVHEAVDLLAQGVQIEARARRRGYAELPHEWLRAVVARADGDALPPEDLRDVVRVDALDVEGDDPAAALRRGRTVDADAVDLADTAERVLGELVLVRLDRLEADLVQVVDRGAEADGLREGRRDDPDGVARAARGDPRGRRSPSARTSCGR
jgi:hypothetical protein